MTEEQINHHAILMHTRQAEKPLREQLSLFARENGYNDTNQVEKAWYHCKHDFEREAPFGNMYTLSSIKGFLNQITS